MYQKALELKPDQEYPLEKLNKIKKKQQKTASENAVLEAKQRELKQRYEALIGNADASMKKEDWAKAKSEYGEAMTLLPERPYPKKQIDIIDQKLSDIAAVEAKAKADKRQRKRLLD